MGVSNKKRRSQHAVWWTAQNVSRTKRYPANVSKVLCETVKGKASPQYTLPSSVHPASLQRTIRPSWSIIMLPSSTLRMPLIFLPWIARGVEA